jgi:uncharacterized protein (TIGR02246 family)
MLHGAQNAFSFAASFHSAQKERSMNYRHILGIFVIAAGAICALAVVTDRQVAAAADEEQAIRKAADAYAAAFNQGNLEGVLSTWMADAEYVDPAGQSTKGRDALTAMFKKSFQENNGIKIQIKTTAIRLVKDDVAMQDGNVLLTRPNGETVGYAFSTVWVKKEGKWMLHLVRDLPGQPTASDAPTHAGLKDLGWLAGEWKHVDKDTTTTINGRWLKGQKFLVLDYSVQNKKEELLSLMQVIGWDPREQKLRSWVFDAHGGFGEGVWSRHGSAWTVESAGVTADGRHGSGTNKWTLLDDDSFTYQTFHREIGGQPLPDVKVTYQRTQKAK